MAVGVTGTRGLPVRLHAVLELFLVTGSAITQRLLGMVHHVLATVQNYTSALLVRVQVNRKRNALAEVYIYLISGCIFPSCKQYTFCFREKTLVLSKI